MKKFKYFGVVIHPKDANNYDWKNLSKNEIIILLRELSFPTPKEVGVILTNISVKGKKKIKKSCTNETIPKYC